MSDNWSIAFHCKKCDYEGLATQAEYEAHQCGEAMSDPGKDEIIEMRLCEVRFLILKPQTYRFTVDPTCEECLKAEQESRGE